MPERGFAILATLEGASVLVTAEFSRELATGPEPHTLFTTSELIKLRNLQN